MGKVSIITFVLVSLFPVLIAQDNPNGISERYNRELSKAQKQVARGDKAYEVVEYLKTVLDSLSRVEKGSLPERVAVQNEIYQRTISAGAIYTKGYDNMFAILAESYQRYQKQNSGSYDDVNKAIVAGGQKMKEAGRLYRKSRRTFSESAAVDLALRARELQKSSVETLLQLGSMMALTDNVAAPRKSEPKKHTEEQPVKAIEREYDNIGHTMVFGGGINVGSKAGLKDDVVKPNIYNIYYVVQFKTLTSEASLAELKRWYAGKEFVEMKRFDQYYRYSVGKFYSLNDANRFISDEKMSGFVVAYKDNDRIAVVQARNIIGR